MKTCPWCGEKIHPQMGNICVACWALKTRIEKHPDIAKRMLAAITMCADDLQSGRKSDEMGGCKWVK